MKKVKYIERPFTVKSADESTGKFTGYASVFGELDSYRDIVMPGAFVKSLREDFTAKDRKVPMLRNHNSDNPIGVYSQIYEDRHGLYVEGECNMDVQAARETHSLMRQGALTGLSIGYTTVVSEWDEKALTRKLIELNLWEVSPVTFPAGDTARINDVKSIEGFSTLSQIEDSLRDAGYSSKEAATLISRIKAITTQGDPVGADSLKNVSNILKSIRNR